MQQPSAEVTRSIAESLGFTLSDDEVEDFRTLMADTLASFDAVDLLPAPDLQPVRYPRVTGHRARPDENPYNAWYWKSEVVGASSGILAGKKLALKDNVPLAGVPMMLGSAIFEGFVPDFDATIVNRVLDAGVTIVGKAVTEDMCFSGNSASARTGWVQNPAAPGYSAGGSSSGSAAVVAAGDVDFAVGCDQGGSIRIPASNCGIVGLKPTWGLVPYTGILPLDNTLDHAGPMARTVLDAALLLEAMAGRDGLDWRQPTDLQVPPYSQLLDTDLTGVKVGIMQEGFAWEGAEIDGMGVKSEEVVDESVRSSIEALRQAGAEVTVVSVPEHRRAFHLWNVIACQGWVDLNVHGSGFGTNRKGFYPWAMMDAARRGYAERSVEASDNIKIVSILGEFVQREHGGRYYAKAQNAAHNLVAAYDRALAEVDVLAMPTLPIRATKLPGPDSTRIERAARSLEMMNNTCPFDVTGHPALTIPCQPKGERPIGLMFVGRHFDDAMVLRVAAAHEKLHHAAQG